MVLGDFNLNEEMKYNNEYSHKSYYDELNLTFDPLGLIQLVDFETWRRVVNGNLKTSTLDHVYTDDVTTIEALFPLETIIGDHSLIMMTIRNVNKESPVVSRRRNWSKYSKEKLLSELSRYEMNWQIDDVQSEWNKIEQILVEVTDKLAPLCDFLDNVLKQTHLP